MTLGQRIQQIRVNHGLSQEAFADKLGTTRQTVSRWELNQTYPEIAKIVLISKIFCVSTDSILKEGISTFDTTPEFYLCGVYRGPNIEIVETEKFSLVLYSSLDNNILGMKLYKGYEYKKNLIAVCERHINEKETRYAYFTDNNDMNIVAISNNEELCSKLREPYNVKIKEKLKQIESFFVDHSGEDLPTVKQAGIPGCLTKWRMSDTLDSTHDLFNFLLCTGKTEYVFSIRDDGTNIYCGASYNIVFDLGLFGAGQYFRIRHYKDNKEKFCGFGCNFSYMVKDATVPTNNCNLCASDYSDNNMMWCVKRYSDEEIVLRGCKNDEYVYRKNDRRVEIFTENI